MISAKFVPLKYYTLSLQLQRLTSFSVGCSGRRILSPGQIAVMRKWSRPIALLYLESLMGVCCSYYGRTGVVSFSFFLSFFLLFPLQKLLIIKTLGYTGHSHWKEVIGKLPRYKFQTSHRLVWGGGNCM